MSLFPSVSKMSFLISFINDWGFDRRVYCVLTSSQTLQREGHHRDAWGRALFGELDFSWDNSPAQVGLCEDRNYLLTEQISVWKDSVQEPQNLNTLLLLDSWTLLVTTFSTDKTEKWAHSIMDVLCSPSFINSFGSQISSTSLSFTDLLLSYHNSFTLKLSS